MGKKTMVTVVFLVSLFLAAAYNAHAECYNEDVCFKDYISQKDENTVIAVNRDTNIVELYWSEKDNAWLKPDSVQQAKLQKLYDKKLWLRQMQGHMYNMNRSTMYTTNQGGGRSR
jgi:hypothetical protein